MLTTTVTNIWTEVVAKAGNPWTFAELAQFLRQNDNLRQLVTLLDKVCQDEKVEMLDPTVLTRILLSVKSYSTHHATMLKAEIIDFHASLDQISEAGPKSKYWDWLRLESEEEKESYSEERTLLNRAELQSWMLPGYSDCLQRFLLPRSRATEFKPLENVLKPIEFILPKIQVKSEGSSHTSRGSQPTSQQTKEKAFKAFFKDPGKQTLASIPRKRKKPITNRGKFKRAKRARALTLEDVEKMKAEERLAHQQKETMKKEAKLKKQQQRKRRTTKVSTNPALDMKNQADAKRLKQMIAQGMSMDMRKRFVFPQAPKGHKNPSYAHLPHMNPAFVTAAPGLSALPQFTAPPGVPLPSFPSPQSIFVAPKNPIPQPQNAIRKHAFKQVARRSNTMPVPTMPAGIPPAPPSLQKLPAAATKRPPPPAMEPAGPHSASGPPNLQKVPGLPNNSAQMVPPMQPVPPPRSQQLRRPQPPVMEPSNTAQRVTSMQSVPPAAVPVFQDPFSVQHHLAFRQKLPFLYNDCPNLSVRNRTEILNLLLGRAHSLGSGDVNILLDNTKGIYLQLNTQTKSWKKIQRKQDVPSAV